MMKWKSLTNVQQKITDSLPWINAKTANVNFLVNN